MYAHEVRLDKLRVISLRAQTQNSVWAHQCVGTPPAKRDVVNREPARTGTESNTHTGRDRDTRTAGAGVGEGVECNG